MPEAEVSWEGYVGGPKFREQRSNLAYEEESFDTESLRGEL